MHILRDYLHDRRMTLIENYDRKTKKLSKGAPQGSVVGPDSWNICLDGMLQELEENGIRALAYADDISIVVGERAEESWSLVCRKPQT